MNSKSDYFEVVFLLMKPHLNLNITSRMNDPICLNLGDCLVGVWKLEVNCLEGFWWVSGDYLKGVWSGSTSKSIFQRFCLVDLVVLLTN